MTVSEASFSITRSASQLSVSSQSSNGRPASGVMASTAKRRAPSLRSPSDSMRPGRRASRCEKLLRYASLTAPASVSLPRSMRAELLPSIDHGASPSYPSASWMTFRSKRSTKRPVRRSSTRSPVPDRPCSWMRSFAREVVKAASASPPAAARARARSAWSASSANACGPPTRQAIAATAATRMTNGFMLRLRCGRRSARTPRPCRSFAERARLARLAARIHSAGWGSTLFASDAAASAVPLAPSSSESSIARIAASPPACVQASSVSRCGRAFSGWPAAT